MRNVYPLFALLTDGRQMVVWSDNETERTLNVYPISLIDDFNVEVHGTETVPYSKVQRKSRDRDYCFSHDEVDDPDREETGSQFHEITNKHGYPQLVDEEGNPVCSECQCLVHTNTGQGTACSKCQWEAEQHMAADYEAGYAERSAGDTESDEPEQTEAEELPIYRPTGREQVQVLVEAMTPIPAGANPFNHDDWSMGTDLVRGWVVMHKGQDNKDEPEGLSSMYLVNTRSGQRIRLRFAPEIPEGHRLPEPTIFDAWVENEVRRDLVDRANSIMEAKAQRENYK